MAVLSLIDAGYKYPGTGRWVLKHIDLTIESGETIQILGRNGSGKTTLLKILSGWLLLSEGEFRKPRTTFVSYMDQFSGEMLARDLTVEEQIRAAAKNLNSLNASIDMLNSFGLDLKDRRQEFVGHLSGGQRQIVALLCTLAAGTDVICLDEFTSSMDQQSVDVANALLGKLHATSNLTLVLVSHSENALRGKREFTLEGQ